MKTVHEDEFPQLNAEEKIVMQDSAKRIRNEGQTKDKGTLVLTNQRFIFGYSSFLSKKVKISIDITLDQIEKIKTKGLIGKQLIVGYMEENRVGQSEYEKSYFKVSDMDEWVSKLEDLTQLA